MALFRLETTDIVKDLSAAALYEIKCRHFEKIITAQLFELFSHDMKKVAQLIPLLISRTHTQKQVVNGNTQVEVVLINIY